MIKKYMHTTYIVHSHELNESGIPKQEYKSRLEMLINVLRGNFSEKIRILLTGGKATQGINTRHCDAGLNYLINLGIPEELISVEKDSYGSLETVGESIFILRDYFNLLKNSNVINLISSDYHERRILEIQKYILGEPLSRRLRFIGVNSSIHGNLSRTKEQEENSLNAFFDTFKGVNSGDIENIENRLWQSHPIYQNHPFNPLKK